MRLGEWLPCSPRGGPCRSGRTLLVDSLTDQDEKRLLPDEKIPGLTEKLWTHCGVPWKCRPELANDDHCCRDGTLQSQSEQPHRLGDHPAARPVGGLRRKTSL